MLLQKLTSRGAGRELAKVRVLTRAEQRIGVISLNQPKLNQAVHRDIIAGISQLERSNCKAIVLAGNTSKLFTSGLDPEALRTGDWYDTPNLADVVTAVAKSTLPTVAALDGLVSGGGVELALACNFRVGGRKTVFSMPDTVEHNLLPGAQGTQRLPRVIGVRRALELMLLRGNTMTGTEAKEAGLLNEIVPDEAEEDVYETSLALAERLDASSNIQSVDFFPNAKPISREEIEAIVQRAVNGGGINAASAQAVVDAVHASTYMQFNKGVEFETFLFRELITAHQRTGVIQFQEVVAA